MSISKLPKGKIPYVPTWHMNCEILPMIQIENNNAPGAQIVNYGGHLENFNDFEITITYDNEILHKGVFVNAEPIVIDHHFQDDKQNTNHLFDISLAGKTDQHSWHYQDIPVSLCIKLDISIEDISMDSILSNQGLSAILGVNATQTFAIQTPIYQWLLQNINIITELDRISQ